MSELRGHDSPLLSEGSHNCRDPPGWSVGVASGTASRVSKCKSSRLMRNGSIRPKWNK